MAREVISSIWDRTNRNNLNNNFEELYNNLGIIRDGGIGTRHLLDGAVTNSKIAPEAVTESKLGTRSVSSRALALGSVNPRNVKFVREPVINLFNRQNIIDDKVVNYSTGQLTDHENFVTTEDIEVEGGVTYSLSQIYYLVFKDAEGNIIGDVITSPQHSLNQVTSPTDAKTVQFSINKNGFPDLNDFIFVRGNQYTLDAYTLEISHLKLKDDAVSWENSDYLTRTNEHAVVDLYTDYKMSEKGYMALTTNGEFVSTTSTTNYRHTDFISVTPGTFLLRKYQRHFVFYDKNKIFITGNAAPNSATREGKNGYGMTVPANAKYVVLNVREPDTDEYLLQVRNESSALKIPELIIEKHQIKDFNEHITSGNPLDGKTGVAFGDSITQSGEYTQYISDMANCDYINVGFGATRLSRSDRLNYPWAKINMCELTDSIVTNDWTVTDSAIAEIDAHYGNTTYSTIHNRLKSIDFNNVDFITFMYGTNDVSTAVFELGAKDSVDTYTVNGALNHILQSIMSTYPHIKVYVLSPIFRQKNSAWGPGDSDDSKMPDGVYLYDIAQAIVDKAKEYHVPVKDMYNESGINRYNADHFLKDGVHPGDAGNQLMNEVIYKYLQSY